MLSHRDLIARRLAGVLLTSQRASSAADVVRHLGAVQSQDYSGAKWAIAQRTRGLTDAAVDREFDAGAMIRTHVLRPTWHFVAPGDARWMLALTGPRVARVMGRYDAQFGLDAKVYRRSTDAIATALIGGNHLTRTELSAVIARARVPVTSSMKLTRLMMHAELNAVICSGPRRGKQFTYALFDERVPASVPLDRDEALLTLVCRYYSTRGPATLHDFAWWSGLTVGDAKRGVAMAGMTLVRGTYDGADHWFADDAHPRVKASAMLLPNYDEYFIGYKDRSAVGRRMGHANAVIGGDRSVTHTVYISGELVGRWRRVAAKGKTVVELSVEAAVNAEERRRIAAETTRLSRFLGTPVETTRGEVRRRS